MRTTLFAISILLAWPTEAQDLYSTGTCPQSTGDAYLETSGLRARILANGALFWRGTPNVLEIPRGSGVQAMFVDNLIVGGWVDDELRVSGSDYGPYEFWAGPIPENGSSPDDCEQNDRLWTLSLQADLNDELWPGAPPPNVADWPGHLDAPFKDADGEAGYNPGNGDRPRMRGDHMVWWIMNDRGNVHTHLDSEPLGLEVRGSAWGFDAGGWMKTTMFMRHEITNRGDQPIQDAYLSRLTDSDFGYSGDDTWSTDTTNSALLFYNTDNDDEGGYGENPPALGLVFLDIEHSSRPLSFDMVDSRPRYITSSSRFIGSASSIDGDIGRPEDWYNYAQGLWKSGQTMFEGGDGYRYKGVTSNPSKFWMPGDPVTGTFWSPTNYSGVPFPAKIFGFDAKSMASFGPFDLAPGESITLTTAYVWRRGADFLDSVSLVREAAGDLHQRKDVLTALRDFPTTEFIDGNPPESPQFPFWVDEPYPNPADDRLTFRASFDKSGPVRIRIIDSLGRTRLEQTHQAQSAGEQSLELDTSSLSPGAYTVTVESWSHRASNSFVVLR
jgi:hypothetical protein